MDSEGVTESVCIGVIWVKKHLLLEQNTKDIKEHISTVKLNISNFHKVLIPGTKSTETLQKTLIYIVHCTQSTS